VSQPKSSYVIHTICGQLSVVLGRAELLEASAPDRETIEAAMIIKRRGAKHSFLDSTTRAIATATK
jgi:hypothetical protein